MKRILILSDTHVGSTVGLWPDNFMSVSGHELPQSRFQIWLWDKWRAMQHWVGERVKKSDDLTLVFNGDIIEGLHHRSIEVMSAAMDDQYVAASTIFRDLIDTLKPARSYMIRGTECHTNGAEATVGKLIGSEKNKEGLHAFDYKKLSVDGTVCSFAHHMSCSTRKGLQASAHSAIIDDEVLRSIDAGFVPARVVCRAHRHEHGVWSTGSTMSCVTGPWQGLTRHGWKVVPGAVPKPSAILLSFTGELLPKVDCYIAQPRRDDNLERI